MKTMKHLSFALFALLLSAGASGAADAPEAAVNACLKHANAYNDAAPGTAKFNGSAEENVALMGPGAGDYWRLLVDVEGGVDISCTVSADGKTIMVNPAG